MRIIMNPLPVTKYGGRILYTVNQKKDGGVFSMRIGQNDDTYKSVAIAFCRKQDAEVFAFALECHKYASPTNTFPNPTFDYGDDCDISDVLGISRILYPDVVGLHELYVHTWDSYHIKDKILSNNIALLVYDANQEATFSCSGKLFSPSEDMSHYIQHLDAIIAKE